MVQRLSCFFSYFSFIFRSSAQIFSSHLRLIPSPNTYLIICFQNSLEHCSKERHLITNHNILPNLNPIQHYILSYSKNDKDRQYLQYQLQSFQYFSYSSAHLNSNTRIYYFLIHFSHHNTIIFVLILLYNHPRIYLLAVKNTQLTNLQGCYFSSFIFLYFLRLIQVSLVYLRFIILQKTNRRQSQSFKKLKQKEKKTNNYTTIQKYKIISWILSQQFCYLQSQFIIQKMLSRILNNTFANFSKQMKDKSVRQRRKFYSKFPDTFKLKTIMRPPDLSDPDLTFPLRIPIRYRHVFHLKKKAKQYLDTTQKIHWDRLQPNQILLAFEHLETLTFKQIVEGLIKLSELKDQQKYNWNEHQWVSKALASVKANINMIKKNDVMSFYFLMKRLQYADTQFWKKLYSKIQQNYYDFTPKQFQYLYLTYYDKMDEYFKPETKNNFHKLMEGRLRQFSPQGILKVFQNFIRDKKIDNYWLQNVFVSLFKNIQYVFSPKQICTILRSMMILEHQNNDRLYESLYNRVRKLNIQKYEDAELLEQVLNQVKQIFTSHRVESLIEYIEKKKEEVKQKSQEQKKKSLQQIIQDDLKYFFARKKLKQQQKVKKEKQQKAA